MRPSIRFWSRSTLRSICLFLSVFFGIGSFLTPTVDAQTPPTEAWIARYNGPANRDDRARKVVVDAGGNVYVTGSSVGSVNADYTTVKYDSSGVQLWVVRYNNGGSDIPVALALDTVGNVYVTGSSQNTLGQTDYATVKYDSNGNQLWVMRYDSNNGAGESFDNAYALTLDATGNVFVTGSSFASVIGNINREDYLTIKYDTNGNQLWTASYHHVNRDVATSIGVDSAGNVYVTGDSYKIHPVFGTFNSDYATVKYDSNGGQLWVARYNHNENNDSPLALVLDAAGNTYVTGGSGFDYATVKYDSNGSQLWAARYDNGGNDGAVALALDPSGNVYVTGSSFGANIFGFPDYATIKYDSNGNQLWAARYTNGGLFGDSASALAVDMAGNVYVTGSSYGLSGNPDYATLKYNPTGNQLWVARYNHGSNDSAADVAVDLAGHVYVTGGSFSGSFPDYATIKYVQVVVPVIGPPATLELTPPSAANTVGESHTVTATVKDALQQPTPGITVRFSVEGSVTASGAAVTDANGQAGFTYGGPQLPGADMIRAYADTDNNNVQDAGEPFGDATKAWLAPATTSGQVTGGGQTQNTTGTGQIAFGFNAKSDDLVNGNCNVVDRSISLQIKCSSVDSLTVSGTHATIFGMASDNGTETPFRIDVDDLGEPGRGRDTFRIITGTGYSAGGTLMGGNIQIHQ